MGDSVLDSVTDLVERSDRRNDLPVGVSVSISTAKQKATFTISNRSTTISQVFTKEELEFIDLGHGLGQFVFHLIDDCVIALHNATLQKRLIALHRGK